jgi:hypothetical protein
MKHVLGLILSTSLIILGGASCGNSKKNNVDQVAAMMMEGEVRLSNVDGECVLWIMTTKISAFSGFYPVNLDEQFKVNGLKIAFNYSDSRAPLPENCFNLKAIVISEVRIVK